MNNNWILSDAFWKDLIGTNQEAKAKTRKYRVPKNWSDIFWGEFKKVVR
jgi:hypothetical protein